MCARASKARSVKITFDRFFHMWESPRAWALLRFLSLFSFFLSFFLSNLRTPRGISFTLALHFIQSSSRVHSDLLLIATRSFHSPRASSSSSSSSRERDSLEERIFNNPGNRNSSISISHDAASIRFNIVHARRKIRKILKQAEESDESRSDVLHFLRTRLSTDRLASVVSHSRLIRN